MRYQGCANCGRPVHPGAKPAQSSATWEYYCRRPECVARMRYWARLKRDYNLSKDQFEELYAVQHGKCGVCRCRLEIDTTHVDHDHHTGLVRGLLCRNCNRGLGLLGDDLPSLKAAVTYIARSGRRRPS